MVCKYCNAQLDEDSAFCPVCGKEQEPLSQVPAENPQEETVIPVEETVPEVDTEEAADNHAPQEQSAAVVEASGAASPKKKRKAGKIIGILAAALGLVGLGCGLTVLVLTALGVSIPLFGMLKDFFNPPEEDVFVKESYTAEAAEDAMEEADDVVATMGDAELTNAQLQIFYAMQIQDFLSYYGSYLESLNLDYTKPLSQQTSYFDESKTWEQYFVDIAINSWQNLQALALQAEKDGFTLSDEFVAELDKIPANLEEQAAEGEFESADAMVQALIGGNCTLEDYMVYVRLNALANEYFAAEYEKRTPTAEEVEAYFTENEATFAESGITKDALQSAVRHILVCPTGGTTDANGAVTYSDEDWAACLTKAEDILKEWEAGEATEQSFAELVATYSEDPGSVANGGLYENITATSSYVENFLNWSIDTSRKPGDTGIVKTEYGYHIMYYVSGETYWEAAAQTQLMSERAEQIIDDAMEAWPIEVTYKKIFLAELELG